MEVLQIPRTSRTPSVHFDADQGIFCIEGKSIPEDVIEFYRPLFEWFEEYNLNPNDETIFEVKLEYFNTASSKVLFDFIKVIRKIEYKDKSVILKWYCEEDDDDILEYIDEVKGIFNFPIEIELIEFPPNDISNYL